MYSSSSNSVSQNVGKGSSTIILTQDNVENTNGLNNTLVIPSPVQLTCQTARLEWFQLACIIAGQM